MACGVGARWTEEERQAIREHFPSHGTRWDGWSELLNDRTPEAIQRMAGLLGVYREDGTGGRGWTADEDQALRDHFPTHGRAWDGWARVLPKRTWAGITKHASVLGIRHDESVSMGYHTPWSAADDAALEALWPYHTGTWDGWAVILPGRTYTSITNRAALLQERRRQRDESDAAEELKRHKAAWTTDQTRELLRGFAALAKATGHTPAEVLQRGYELCHTWERQRERDGRSKKENANGK